jgi:hypothetical protein
MSGDNNSCHKIKDRLKWKQNVSKALIGKNVGTLEERFGFQKSQ